MGRIPRLKIWAYYAAAVAAAVAVSACSSQPASSASSSNAASSTYIIKYGGKLPANNPQGIGQVEFAKLAEQLSKGKIQVKNYFNGVLGSSESMNDQVHSGIIQMTDTSPTNLETMYPGMGVFSVPFLFPSEDAALAEARGPIGSQIAQAFEQKTGIKVLAWDEFGMAQIIGNKPFTTLSDLRGQKVRSQSDEYTEKPFSLVGAVPVPVDANEVFTSLSTHVIDDDVIAIPPMYSDKDYEIVKNLTIANLLWYGNCILINEKFYNSLPAALRADVTKAAQEAANDEVGVTKTIEAQDIAAMEKQGVKSTTLPTAQISAWKKILAPVYSDADKQFGASVVNSFRNDSS